MAFGEETMQRLRLRRRDPARNMDRFYSLLPRQTLFGDHVVTREWGRVGRSGTVREQWPPDAASATADFERPPMSGERADTDQSELSTDFVDKGGNTSRNRYRHRRLARRLESDQTTVPNNAPGSRPSGLV